MSSTAPLLEVWTDYSPDEESRAASYLQRRLTACEPRGSDWSTLISIGVILVSLEVVFLGLSFLSDQPAERLREHLGQITLFLLLTGPPLALLVWWQPGRGRSTPLPPPLAARPVLPPSPLKGPMRCYEFSPTGIRAHSEYQNTNTHWGLLTHALLIPEATVALFAWDQTRKTIPVLFLIPWSALQESGRAAAFRELLQAQVLIIELPEPTGGSSS